MEEKRRRGRSRTQRIQGSKKQQQKQRTPSTEKIMKGCIRL